MCYTLIPQIELVFIRETSFCVCVVGSSSFIFSQVIRLSPPTFVYGSICIELINMWKYRYMYFDKLFWLISKSVSMLVFHCKNHFCNGF